MTGKREHFDNNGEQFQYREPDSHETPALENVLRETLDALTRERISRQEIEALRNVAARHRNQPLAIDPVTVEMVDVVLDARIDLKKCSPAGRREMSLEIATALHEAPESCQRLEHLWRQLQESLS